jgi:hypothetical protein
MSASERMNDCLFKLIKKAKKEKMNFTEFEKEFDKEKKKKQERIDEDD